MSRAKRFQFPTGWNSTPGKPSARVAKLSFQFPTGWNSTQTLRKSIGGFAVVSIPNGMEFYLGFSAVSAMADGFNSQRDGLRPPLYTATTFAPDIQFLFPPGWNSTLGLSEEEYAKGMFQFPTGWNSTLL